MKMELGMKKDESTILLGQNQPDKLVECPFCKHVGIMSDFRRRPMEVSWWKFKGNRQGWEYLCPECGGIAIRQYIP